MKRAFVVLYVLVAAATVFAAGRREASGITAQDKSLTAVLNKKKLVVGLDDSFPPMGFRNEANEIVGYDVDLAKELGSRLGIQIVFQPIDWNAKEQELNTGEIDCIWNGFTITEERQKAMTFTKAYLKNAQVVVVKASSLYKDLNDLVGKKAGVQAGSSALEAIEDSVDFKNGLAELVEYKDNLTALMDLEVEGIDAVVMDLLVANDNINRSGKGFRILNEALAPEEYGIGFRKGEQALADKVWETLEAMAKDGTIGAIATRWFGADISIVGK
ncbi:MAG: amino acid ABC transporter substrate-binding protein [Spirochaetaceae bacterium]|jgi:polar amino acid transport system substrate-binding protein|nr:amino acid ABC transporter substrate-binding protein [Spirochaetaceae bacterium]